MERSATFNIGDRLFRWKPAPHLNPGADIHTAYDRMIDRIVSQSQHSGVEIEVPAYPLRFDVNSHDLLFEMVAYWEGAIYFLNSVLKASTLCAGIDSVTYPEQREDNASFNHRNLFLSIWNSHGQLKWLQAFAVRSVFLRTGAISTSDIFSGYALFEKAHESDDPIAPLAELADFVYQHKEEGSKYPNPYFGGTNALHLGMGTGITQEFVEGEGDW